MRARRTWVDWIAVAVAFVGVLYLLLVIASIFVPSAQLHPD